MALGLVAWPIDEVGAAILPEVRAFILRGRPTSASLKVGHVESGKSLLVPTLGDGKAGATAANPPFER